jgi:RHS repeat-associated protein
MAYDESTVTLGTGGWARGISNPKGRLTHTTTVSGSTLETGTVWSYDAVGRTQKFWECSPGNCNTSSFFSAYYNYDLAGDVTWWNHPAGFTINQPVDNARHIQQVTSTWSDGQHPATLASGACLPNSTSICYTAWGAVSSLQNPCVGSGCPVQETYFYNKRLQTAVAELGTPSSHALDSCREYSYYEGVGASGCSETPSSWPTGTNNNGNVGGYLYQDSMNALGHTATYHYDGVNRLSSAVATGNVAYNQSFGYDQYGNLACTANPSNPKCLAPTYNAATNRIAGYQYDAAGNLINDGTYGYQWDAEGKLTAITLSGNTIASNIYNALGQNMRHQAPGVTIDEYYGADGALLGRGTGTWTDTRTRVFVPFQGRILAEYYGGSTQGTLFDHPDELGSLSIATDYATSHSQERLFYPFGEFWTGSDLYSLGMHQTFAQLPDYDNDSNSDLYNTLNRHYTPMGRWLSPDPGGVKVVKLDDPQTWNMYAYVRNNPTTLTDPSGLVVQVDDEDALKRIKSTLPKSVRKSITLDKNRNIDKGVLNKVKSSDPNVKALKDLVNNSKTIEVATGNSVNLKGMGKVPFEYASVNQIVADLKAQGISIDPKSIIATSFLGYTFSANETASGNALVVLSDRTGKASTAPWEELAITTAHEIYGHGLLQLQGRAWMHDNGAPVDQDIRNIEQHTREVYEPD